jgi:hypothetical protein
MNPSLRRLTARERLYPPVQEADGWSGAKRHPLKASSSMRVSEKGPCRPSDEKPAGLLTGLRTDEMPLELFQHSGELYAK